VVEHPVDVIGQDAAGRTRTGGVDEPLEPARLEARPPFCNGGFRNPETAGEGLGLVAGRQAEDDRSPPSESTVTATRPTLQRLALSGSQRQRRDWPAGVHDVELRFH
jgi:hypothetical protein